MKNPDENDRSPESKTKSFVAARKARAGKKSLPFMKFQIFCGSGDQHFLAKQAEA
jgi:hypothetical protein